MTREEAREELIKFVGSFECPSVEALNMAIEALSTEPKWIPVSERMPDNPKDVLTTLSNGMVCIGRYHSFDKWTFEAASIMIAFPEEAVIAWMPLPEPYNGSDEG